MKTQSIGGALEGSRLILGMMRHSDLTAEDFDAYMKTALALGINVIDHADIYGGGDSEQVFGDWLSKNKGLRDQMVLQTKCGIRDGYYDLSKAHILKSVEGSLKRLGTDCVDVLMLHRPDALMVPEEVAEALVQLKAEGKVKHFGVSNMHPMQIERLQAVLPMPLIANQVQFGLKHTDLIDCGLQVNTNMSGAEPRAGYLMEYAQLKGMTLQAWSPLQFGFFDGNFIGHPDFEILNRELTAAGLRYGVTPEAMAVAWILAHPAKLQVVLGTTNPERLKKMEKATQVTMDRETWYGLYRAAGNPLP